MKKNVCIALFLSFLYFGAFSQSADKLTEMLNAQTVTIEQLSYFAANYLNLAGETATGEEALSALKEHIGAALCFAQQSCRVTHLEN